MKLNEIAEDPTDNEAGAEPEELTPAYKDTYNIKAIIFPALEEKIGKLNRKAARLHVPAITLVVEKEFFEERKDPENPKGPKIREKYYTVKVEGQAPQVRGYKFMATIEHKEGGNIIRTVPGEENNPEIRNFYEAHPDYCDHCHKVRRRNDTFIIKNIETGQLRQIGRNCLADFLGGMDPKQILWYFSLRTMIGRVVGEASEESGRFGRAELIVDTATVLNIAAKLIQEFGYTKRADEEFGRWSTSSMVRFAIFDRLPKDPSEQQIKVKDIATSIAGRGPTPETQQLVNDAVNWFNSLPDEEKQNSEFYHNIDVLLNSKDVSPRDIGYVVALFPAYYRAQGVKRERESKSNEWIGIVGNKLAPTKVKCTNVQKIQTDFGTTEITRMEDEKGNSLVWFNSGHAYGLADGEEATIEGTIKKHDEYKGRKQTILTRVRPAKEPKAKGTSQPSLANQRGNISNSREQPINKEHPVQQNVQQIPNQPREIPVNTGAGSKINQAIAKFQEYQRHNGRIPTMGEFTQILMAPPFNMSKAAASTYYYTTKKRVSTP
jgi:hypothetical protein